MYRLSVLYSQPTDPQAFDEYYTGTHMPLAAKLPGIRSAAVSKGDTLDGSTPDIYQVAELYFDSKQDLMAALGSEEGRALTADLPNFVTGDVSMVFTEVTEFPL
ncbi:EthD family reductase [Gordonia neofelifaecis]|uniref:EthD domain-containing protein n=1 Tax=Gordonia neofelifaecis NRRL B-59395 TaxID=644548 RepID=F1YJQ4_9ACTN|nr:EthD family reductase [Gordonia neofelifaecis]EGD54986.1 hypothetical protein SCNU_10661 [Gordonia neofelifaecis NRRL B-59395]